MKIPVTCEVVSIKTVVSKEITHRHNVHSKHMTQKYKKKSLIESGEGKRDFHYNRLAQQENRNKTQLRCTSKEQTNEHSENKRTNIRSFLCLFTLARANLQKLRPWPNMHVYFLWIKINKRIWKYSQRNAFCYLKQVS